MLPCWEMLTPSAEQVSNTFWRSTAFLQAHTWRSVEVSHALLHAGRFISRDVSQAPCMEGLWKGKFPPSSLPPAISVYQHTSTSALQGCSVLQGWERLRQANPARSFLAACAEIATDLWVVIKQNKWKTDAEERRGGRKGTVCLCKRLAGH